jgi:hypothetical protein
VFARLITLDPNPAVPLCTGGLRRRGRGEGVLGRDDDEGRMLGISSLRWWEVSMPFGWLVVRKVPDDIAC